MSDRTTRVGSDYERLFSALSKESVPLYLCEQVAGRIRRERLRNTRVRLVVASLCGITSAAGGLYALTEGVETASKSGFFSYLSLAFSDSGFVAKDISVFGLSLLESFPVIETFAFFALAAVLLASLRVIGQALAVNPIFTYTRVTI